MELIALIVHGIAYDCQVLCHGNPSRNTGVKENKGGQRRGLGINNAGTGEEEGERREHQNRGALLQLHGLLLGGMLLAFP